MVGKLSGMANTDFKPLIPFYRSVLKKIRCFIPKRNFQLLRVWSETTRLYSISFGGRSTLKPSKVPEVVLPGRFEGELKRNYFKKDIIALQL